VIGWCLLIVLGTATDSKASHKFSLRGYYKSYFTVYEPPSLHVPAASDGLNRFDTDPPQLGAVSNRLRLNLRYRPAIWMTFDAAYDFAPRIQDPALYSGEGIYLVSSNLSKYRVDDLRRILYPQEHRDISSFAIFQNLDRLSATIQGYRFDLVLGRQPIAWGAARAINPTDVITPFSYTDLDVEDRVGVDAIRARYALGFMSEIDAGLVFGPDFEADLSAAFLRGKFYAAKTDFSVLLCRFQEHMLLGGDLVRSIGGAGTWLEAAYVILDDDDPNNDDESYFSMSTGADYSFFDGLYGFAEYHFNGIGVTDPAQYRGLLLSVPYSTSSVYLLGRHYFIPGVAYQPSPLISVSAETLINLDDGSAIIVPAAEYNFAEDVYVTIGAYFAVGSGPRVEVFPGDQRPGEIQIDSEFGSYPSSIFSSFKLYF
jgi:hypothetical protein